jgi:hypothetical protein
MIAIASSTRRPATTSMSAPDDLATARQGLL